VILKLIAWDDRPEVRRDDIDDIAEIIKNYFHLNDVVIFEQHSDLFTDDIELDEVASQFLGRELGKIVSGNRRLIARIYRILENGMNDKSNLAELFAIESGETIEHSKSLISHIMKGINEVTSESK
jgi:predicted nucleotidyltransferase